MTDDNNIYSNVEESPDKVIQLDGANEGGEAYNVTRKGISIMLDIKLSSGEGKFITYNMIQEIDYLMDKILSIVTPSCIIEITGVQLATLTKRIARHEVEWIEEGKSNPEGLRIDKIRIHTSADTLKVDN